MRKAKANTKDIEHIVTKKCRICGKNFVPAPQHAYRDRRAPHPMVCSWSCVCKSEQLKQAGIKPGRGRRKNES